MPKRCTLCQRHIHSPLPDCASFVLLKLLFIPVIWYLFKSFQRGQTIYFYLNLGISRTEYYSIPFVVDFVVFVALLTFSICVGNVIR